MRTWFITGASRGFGALIAEKALRNGDAVIATARNPQAVIARIGQHENLLAVSLDVGDEAAARDAIAQGVARFGRIDIVVNNAGYGLLGAVEEASSTEVEALFKTNVFGVLNVIRAVLPQLRSQRSGRLINISSIGAVQAYAGWGVYGATKFAIDGITEALAQELAPLGIHATVVQPGFFRTDFLDDSSLARSKTHIGDYHASVGVTRELAGQYNHAQPGNPALLAEAILKLAYADTPPVHLPLGSDTVARIQQKGEQVAGELQRWIDVAMSTDYAAA